MTEARPPFSAELLTATPLVHLLPSDIPGLREQGMAVDIDNGRTSGVIQTVWSTNGLTCTVSRGGGFLILSAEEAAERLKIDLRNRVSRVLVAWWLIAQPAGLTLYQNVRTVEQIIEAARAGEPMSPENISALTRLTLYVARRSS
jgi:hypothetical protein